MNAFGHLRKSEKRILEVLANSANGKCLTQKEIIKSCDFSPRTVKYALERLVNFGYLITKPVLSDMRTKLYFLQRGSENDFK